MARGVAGNGNGKSGSTTGAGAGTVAQPTPGEGGGQASGSASSGDDAQPGDIVVTARRPSTDLSYLSFAGYGSRRMANDFVGSNPFAIPTYADGHLLSLSDIQQVGMGGGVRPKLQIDVNSPIFFGGGGEGYEVFGQDLTDAVEPYITRRGSGDFFTHWDDSDVLSAIQMTHDAGKPVIMVGHSWGGSDVISAARWARDNQIPVDLLVTITRWNSPIISSGARTPTRASRATGSPASLTSRARSLAMPSPMPWGKTPMAIQGYANVVLYDKNAGHAEFSTMMGTAHAETIIYNIYPAPLVRIGRQ